MVQDGGPGRDLSEYMRWRETADPDLLVLLDLYDQFLAWQIVDGSGALRAEAAIAVLGVMGWQEREIPDALLRLNAIHGIVMDTRRKTANG